MLSPFGSGNPEPKFVIEDLKTLNAKIVAEKHIKSALIGKDGSTIKTIAFNAVDKDFGQYLLQKNNNPFNIAGKLSLNEWKGNQMWSLLSMIFLLLSLSKKRSHRLSVRTVGFHPTKRGSILRPPKSMKYKIAVIEEIHRDGLELLDKNPNYEYELIKDVSESNLIKNFQILTHVL